MYVTAIPLCSALFTLRIAVSNTPTGAPFQLSNTMVQKLTADEQRLFRLYGKLPNKKDLLQNKLKVRSLYPDYFYEASH